MAPSISDGQNVSPGKSFTHIKMNERGTSKEGSDLSPDWLFGEFRKDKLDFGWIYGYRAIDQFKDLENKESFLKPTIQFVKQEKEDRVRGWGMTVLELIGGKEAFQFIIQMLETEHTRDEKHKYLYTRFHALKAIANIASSDNEKGALVAILKTMDNDEEETYLVRAGASAILVRQEVADAELREQAMENIREMLRDKNEYWAPEGALRALREFPIHDLVDDIISIKRTNLYYNHKRHAIQALGSYNNDSKDARSFDDDDLKVVRELGLTVRKDQDDSLRLEAVKSLARLNHPESQEDLISALRDDNAEVRVQASKALKLLLRNEAVSTVVQHALKEGIEEEWLIHLVEALRLIDPDRTLSTQALSKELISEDQRRARVAEQILLELGGWAAVQKISQRRNTLETLDRLLEQSEQAIKDTFHDTITQARRNFYFAMGVNIIIVIVGLFLISLAIMQLIQNPQKLETWIIPGAAGLFGVIMTMFFNNPRQNAREDLTTLMNVNVIFLGFLRRLNEIDATFKYAYIESRSFGTGDMDQTVKQIDNAVIQTLEMAEKHLRNPKQSQIQHNNLNETASDITNFSKEMERSR